MDVLLLLTAIIFDLDNTLVNFWQFKKEASREAARAMVAAGLTMSPERAETLIFNIYKTHGVEYQLTFSELIKPFGFPKLEFEKIRDAGVVVAAQAARAGAVVRAVAAVLDRGAA